VKLVHGGVEVKKHLPEAFPTPIFGDATTNLALCDRFWPGIGVPKQQGNVDIPLNLP
jgi:hypothetical protein